MASMAPSLSRTAVALLAALLVVLQSSAWVAPGVRRGGMMARPGSGEGSAWRRGASGAATAARKSTARVVVVRAEDEREGGIDGEMVEYKGERLATTEETLTAAGEWGSVAHVGRPSRSRCRRRRRGAISRTLPP